jgi:D-alanyl-lipoteichoic acid acyltransferase DltB (MBOAT superfamily)
MLFKFLHMVVDIRQGQLLAFTLFGYLNYQLAFFTLIAGPIQRFNDFQKFWESMSPATADAREALIAWNRLLNGMLKMGLLAAAASFLYDRSAAALLQPQSTLELAARFAVYFYAYPAYVYFNFSGYTDIVLGCAKLLGLQLPENFDRPYLARNVVDFWSRWHISLTTWIRDYVFMTSYKWVAERFSPLAQTAGYVITFLSLLIAGIWHGSTWNFVVFGAMHGAGAAITQMYGSVLKWRLKRAGLKRYNQNPWIRGGAMVLTFHFVCASFLFFPAHLRLTLDRLQAVVNHLR